jgi:hypothetical protein
LIRDDLGHDPLDRLDRLLRRRRMRELARKLETSTDVLARLERPFRTVRVVVHAADHRAADRHTTIF